MTDKDCDSDSSGAASLSTSLSLPSALQGSSPGPISPLGRLTKIEIENYRGFRGRFELDLPDGCNLIVYGENGAGKSSLFHALSDFVENPDRKIDDAETGKSRNMFGRQLRSKASSL